ncbi:MAG: DUF4965 domain-containing protein [Candidatus Hydrogenedentes bacterium]|nr:DUF4965 domain-containing protein [Candidatus Hydrogenedentota bacterium]
MAISLSVFACLMMAQSASDTAFRPPAIPLVTHDPYFSVWSMTDRLADSWSKHWTGANMAMCGMARIDGKTYRLAGQLPKDTPAMEQTSVQVLPTRTIYVFEADGVRLTLTFCSSVLPDKLEWLARPVTYVSFDAAAMDGKAHEMSVYLDTSAEWAVHETEQQVVWGRFAIGGMQAMRLGSKEQPILARTGDGTRIDWGYLYMAVPANAATVMSSDKAARNGFTEKGTLPNTDDLRMPRRANDDWPVLASVLVLPVKPDQAASAHLLLAYDDDYAIELFERRLRSYWRHFSPGIDELLQVAERDYADALKACAAFDEVLMADLTAAGGEKYARLCALAYREALAGQKLAADFDGTPLMFPKENSSNGCISTVDVIYPAAPFFLLFNPALLEAQLKPVLDYAASARWPWPFAPHDLGTYPKANGQVYGGGEKTEKNQMPVEESANMLILLAAIAQVEGNADFSARYVPTLTKWAGYLLEKGLDPENQLCTDDFAGHLAHNANLSAKAIVALAAYARLCEQLKLADDAHRYRAAAEDMAKRWAEMATDGDHYRLAFDKPGTWSQKYNLVWDRLLGLNLFPREVVDKEIAYYKRVQNKYGLPLDNRKDYTKTDWLIWTATLAQSREDFDALAAPAYAFANDTPDRHALSDWYDTKTAKMVGFTARPVIGGLFIKMLADENTWHKWSKGNRQ